MLAYSSKVNSESGSNYLLVELTFHKASRIMDTASVDDHMILTIYIINSNLYLILKGTYIILLMFPH